MIYTGSSFKNGFYKFNLFPVIQVVYSRDNEGVFLALDIGVLFWKWFVVLLDNGE